jgi:hypothetical protein
MSKSNCVLSETLNKQCTTAPEESVFTNEMAMVGREKLYVSALASQLIIKVKLEENCLEFYVELQNKPVLKKMHS